MRFDLITVCAEGLANTLEAWRDHRIAGLAYCLEDAQKHLYVLLESFLEVDEKTERAAGEKESRRHKEARKHFLRALYRGFIGLRDLTIHREESGVNSTVVRQTIEHIEQLLAMGREEES